MSRAARLGTKAHDNLIAAAERGESVYAVHAVSFCTRGGWRSAKQHQSYLVAAGSKAEALRAMRSVVRPTARRGQKCRVKIDAWRFE